ncbi:MAG: ABC transporter substrate-binding protein [Oscillospiraceae bacterium]|nr:ABC transporter substrate-binding protein [Oscillospiraceae bacterium]
MKKILSLILALMMIFSLAACGTADSGTDAGDAASTEDAATEDAAAAEDATAEGDADAAEAEETAEAGDVVYNVGICQLVTHAALDAATQGFKDALTDKLGDSVVFNEQNAAGDNQTCATICNQLVSEKVDLILANATPALQAAASATNEIPIIGTSITDYGTALDIDNWTGTTGTNISGTSDLAPLKEQAQMLNELFPDAKNVGLIYCSSEANSLYQIGVVKAELESMGYTCTEFTFVDSNDVSSVCQSAASNSDVLYAPTDNTVASCAELINNVCLTAGVPIVAGEEGMCAALGVATLSISYYDIGYTAGEMAYDILVNGADISNMEVQFAPNVVKKYNPTICEQLGITVPDDYEAIGE